MAEYKAIHGFTVQNRTSDPLAAGVAGGTWATGGALNTARVQRGGGSGTQTAALAASNTVPYGVEVESYNGTAWSEITEVNTGRRGSTATGTQTASILATGRASGTTLTVNTEVWNGNSWTEVANVNTARYSLSSGIGTSTAMVIAGGNTLPDMHKDVEAWNGASWTEVADYPADMADIIDFGSSTAAIFTGGFDGPGPRGGGSTYHDDSFSWNGASFTSVTALPANRGTAGSAGTTTDGLVFGGDLSPDTQTTSTLSWNGSAWTEVADLAITSAGWNSAKAGTASSALAFGGYDGEAITNTEEWTTAGPTDSIQNTGQVFYRSDTGDMKVTLNVLGTGAWASGGNMGQQRYNNASAGTQTAALTTGGWGGPPVGAIAKTEVYNGTAWTETGDLNIARQWEAGSGSGTNTASLMYGGYTATGSPTPARNKNETESFNGTSWTELANLNTARGANAGGGTQTAAITMSGSTPSDSVATEIWNGASWTEVGDINVSRGGGAAVGQTNTAMLFVGGYTPPGPVVNSNESWNGNSWTELANLNTARHTLARGGSSTSGLIAGGYTTARVAVTEQWNGSAWTEVGDMAVARYGMGGQGGSSLATWASGGNTSGSDPAGVVTTEEWTQPATVTNSTITD
jgi:hypothetical protein